MRRYREGRCNPVSGWGHARLTAVVLTLLVTARLAIVGQPAEASTTPIPPPFFIPLLEKTDFKQADGAKVIISRSLSLQAGESRRVFGRVKATSTTTNTVEFDAGVRCLDSQGNQSGTAAWTGRNHEGYDTDSPYYPTKGQLPLTANLLFRAPTAGIYTCQLLAVKDEKKDPGWLTAIPSDGVGGGTWLQISSADDVGSQWWQNPDCDSQGTWPTCTYLGPTGLFQSWVFYNDGSPINWWAAAGNAAFAEVSATLEVTTCYHGTRSCTASNWGSSSQSVVTSHLEFIQLNSTLGVCKTNQTSDVTSTITNEAHHYMVHYLLPDVPIYPECDSTRFLIRLYVKYVSGNPVKIDGNYGVESTTNAYAINSAYGTAVPVPNVVGSTESAATEMILAAGYLVGNISRIVNTAPNGIVISQNAPGGTIEAPGSAVDLIISLGGCTVPDITGMGLAAAREALAQAPCDGPQGSGPVLVLGHETRVVDFYCNSVGVITDQSPHSGSTLPRGSAVDYWVGVKPPPPHVCP